MKVNDFKQYSNHNLRLIRYNLITNDLDKLPKEITDYIFKINLQSGNINTRTLRCIHFIDEIVVERFINKKIN